MATDKNGHRLEHRFQPGRSGNPAGRPRGPKDVREALQPKSRRFVDALVAALEDPDSRVRIKAIELGLAYIYGKPSEAQPASQLPDGPLSFSPEEIEAAERELTQRSDQLFALPSRTDGQA
jgi:hypothetical protein